MSERSASPADRGRLWAFVLLALVALFWAANTNVARAMAGEVPPLALTFWRLFLSVLIMAPFALGRCWRLRGAVGRHFASLNLLAFLSMSAFNGLVYVGLQHTQAINGNLLQGALPICILISSALFAGRAVSARQWIGVGLGLGGLVVIVMRGDLGLLARLQVNIGDPIVFAGVFASASYAVFLHRRPSEFDLFSFIFLMMVFGSLQTLPFYAWEHFDGRPLPLTDAAIATVVFMAVFPSVLAQLFFAEGIRRVGAQTAGYMIYLTPVFGVLLAIGILGETFHGFHAVGIALIAAGIWLATVVAAKAARR